MKKSTLEKLTKEAHHIVNELQSIEAYERFIKKYPPNIVDQVMARVN